MNRLLIAVFFLLSMSAASVSAAELTNVSANDFTTVFPKMINLTLDQGEMAIEKVALTIHPFCFRPYEVDVVASDPDALVTNATGIVVNGCGGDTSTFAIEFTGTGASQFFDLQFVDAEFGGEGVRSYILTAAIPVITKLGCDDLTEIPHRLFVIFDM